MRPALWKGPAYHLHPGARSTHPAIQHDQFALPVHGALRDREARSHEEGVRHGTLFRSEIRIAGHHDGVAPQRQCSHRQFHQVLVQVAIVGQLDAPLLHGLEAQQPLLHLVAIVAFIGRKAHHAQPDTAHVAVVRGDHEVAVRRHGILQFDPQGRILQLGLQLRTTLCAERTRETRDGFVAQGACRAVLPLPRIAAQPNELRPLIAVPRCQRVGDLGPARLIGNAAAQGVQGVHVQ